MNKRFFSFLLTLTMFCGFFGSAYGSTEEILERIYIRAFDSSSDVVLIVYKGKILFCYGGTKLYTPMDTRSITKTFLGLATGLLLQEPNFCGIDGPVNTYFPEWKQGIKKDVKIKHLLTHTSGMQSDCDDASCYEFTDTLQMALTSDFTSFPGCSFKYNNKATNLLAGVIRKCTGMSAQEYLRGRLFSPLGINTDTWLCDPAGHNYGMSHLTISAMDLAKIGMLIAQNGSWNGYNYISKEWMNFMKTPSQGFTPFYGALVWLGYHTLDFYWDQPLLDTYRACGIPVEFVEALESLQGRILPLEGHINYGNYRELLAGHLAPLFGSCEGVYDLFQRIEMIGLPIASWKAGHLMTVAARGYMGQQLIVFPDEQLIGVRLASGSSSPQNVDTFADFESLLALLLYNIDRDNESNCASYEISK